MLKILLGIFVISALAFIAQAETQEEGIKESVAYSRGGILRTNGQDKKICFEIFKKNNEVKSCLKGYAKASENLRKKLK